MGTDTRRSSGALRDIIGGGALIVVGVASSVYMILNFQMGTIGRMGPGMFPLALGSILFFLGLIIVVQGITSRPSVASPIDLRSFMSIGSAVLVFGLTVDRVGIVPAVWLLTVIATIFDHRISAFATIILSLALSLIAYLVFITALGLPVRSFWWMGG